MRTLLRVRTPALRRLRLCRSSRGSCSQFNADFALIDADWISLQIDLGRAMENPAGSHVKARAVPGAFDLPIFQAAFGERTKTVRAEFLEGIECAVELDHCNHGATEVDTLRFAFAQAVGVRDCDQLSSDGQFSAHGRESDADGFGRRAGAPAVPTDSDAVVVDHGTADVP